MNPNQQMYGYQQQGIGLQSARAQEQQPHAPMPPPPGSPDHVIDLMAKRVAILREEIAVLDRKKAELAALERALKSFEEKT